LILAATVPAVALAAAPKLPATPAGRHAAAWLAAYNSGDEAAMRAMYEQHCAARELAAVPMERRLRQYAMARPRDGELSPERIVQSEEGFLRLVARAAAGGFRQLDFECEPDRPHGLAGIGVMMLRDPAAAAPRPAPITAAELPGKFDAYLAERAKAGTFAGAVLVARDGQPVLRRAYGLADRRFDAPNREDTRFNVGSLGKLVTKLAIAQLAEAGKLGLDDPLGRWLPDWPKESAGKITVDMLCGHRAGTTDFFNERYRRMDRSSLRHNRDYLALFRGDTLWFEPGTSERYSNGGYVLLGEIVAKASGEDYYDYVRRHVYEPAGMKGTDAYAADDPTPNLAMGYYPEPDGSLRENVHSRPARGSAAGGSYSTVDDLLALEQALRGGRLVGPAWSAWVLGGPRPGPAPGTEGMPERYVLAGGAPGITARLDHVGPWTFVLLSNLDRRLLGHVEDDLHEWLRGARE
jgi:CubicO group peptidase (beta-lactamase class C family)